MTQSLGGAGSLGDAYAELHFRTDSANEDLKQALNKASKDADNIGKTTGTKYTKSFTETVAKEMEREGGDKLVGAIEKEIGKRKVKAKVSIEPDVDNNSLRRAATSFVTGLRNLIRKNFGSTSGGNDNNGFLGFLGAAGGLIGGGFKSAGSSIGNVGSEGPFSALIIPLIASLVAAVAALADVLAPLVNALFFLPAALGTVAAAIIPVVVAFSGFAQILGVALGPDAEAAKKALAGVGEGVGGVISEIQDALPWLKAFKDALQETLFKNLMGIITDLVHSPLFAVFEQGSLDVVTAFGQAIQSIARTLERPEISQFFWNLFKFAEAFWERFGPSIGYFLFSVGEVTNKLFPQFMKFINTMFDLLDQFSGWLDKISNNGQLEGFIHDLKIAVDALLELSRSGWDLIKAIVGAAGDENRGLEFVHAIVTMVDKLTEFFKSEIGKEGMKGLVVLAEVFLAILGSIVVTLVGIAALLEELWKWMAKLIDYAIQLTSWLARILGIGNSQSLGAAATKAASEALSNPALFKHGAEGGIITSPTTMYIGEAGPEALIPLTDQQRAQELANASGLTAMLKGTGGNAVNIGAGAVQINLYGSMSPQDAYAAGQAAGHGVMDVFAKRNTRLAIRSM